MKQTKVFFYIYYPFIFSVEEILADSDSDLEDMETDQPKTNKKKPSTWIEEDPDNIVDFIDPSVSSKITGRINFLQLSYL